MRIEQATRLANEWGCTITGVSRDFVYLYNCNGVMLRGFMVERGAINDKDFINYLNAHIRNPFDKRNDWRYLPPR